MRSLIRGTAITSRWSVGPFWVHQTVHHTNVSGVSRIKKRQTGKVGLFVMVMSVFYLVGFVAPVAERLLRLKPHQSDARDGTLRFR